MLHKTPVVVAKAGSAAAIFTYSDAKDGDYSATVPTDAGTYYVKAVIDETANYTGAEKVSSFVIAKATNQVEFPDAEVALSCGHTIIEAVALAINATASVCM